MADMSVQGAHQEVSDLSDALRLLTHLHNAAGIVRNGSKDVHRQHIRRCRQHPHCGHRCPKQAIRI